MVPYRVHAKVFNDQGICCGFLQGARLRFSVTWISVNFFVELGWGVDEGSTCCLDEVGVGIG